MQVKNTLIKLVVAAAVMLPYAVSAQTSSINAFSPYTMYGIGEINTPGTTQMRSMGGVGVAMGTPGKINLLNPAAYSTIPQKSFLFSFGLEGQNYYNSQKVDNVSKNTAYNTFNFHDIAFQMPVAKKLGLGFSLTPYSSVGYRTKYTQDFDPNDPVWGQCGTRAVRLSGRRRRDGGQGRPGLGDFQEFLVGCRGAVLLGRHRPQLRDDPRRRSRATEPSRRRVGSDNYSISSIKGQVGVLWKAIMNQKRMLTFGATYDFGGNLNPDVTSRIYIGDLYNSTVKGDTTHLALALPRQLSVGAYYMTSKWTLGLDYVYQNWTGGNKATEMTGVSGPDKSAYEVAYTNTSMVKVGVEYTPNYYDVRRFMKRWAYRAGFRYGTYNQTYDGNKIGEYAVTLGVGVPVKFLGSSTIDVGVEYGRRGYNLSERLGLVRQQYFKFSVGFSLFAGAENGEYWFRRPKYD